MKTYKLPPEFDAEVIKHFRCKEGPLFILNTGVYSQMLTETIKEFKGDVKLVNEVFGELEELKPLRRKRSMLPEVCLVQLSKFASLEDLRSFNDWLVDVFSSKAWDATEACIATEVACYEGTICYSQALQVDTCAPIKFHGATMHAGNWFIEEIERNKIAPILEREFKYDYTVHNS